MALTPPPSDYAYISNDLRSAINVLMGGSAVTPLSPPPDGVLSLTGCAITCNGDCYIGDGNVVIGGHAPACIERCIICRFGPRSIAYSRRHALRGKLKKIFIKKVEMHTISRDCASSGSGVICMYYDKLNEIFDDASLLSFTEALDIAEAFHQRQISLCRLASGSNRFTSILPSLPSPQAPSIPVSQPPILTPGSGTIPSLIPCACPSVISCDCPSVILPSVVSSLCVGEIDGNPNVSNVTKILFNGSTEVATDAGNGIVIINAPNSPSPLGGAFDITGLNLFTGRTSQSNINYETVAGDSHNYLTNDVNSVILTEPSFGYASVGVVSVVLNGETIAQIDLGANFVEANRNTGQNIPDYDTNSGTFTISGGIAPFQGSAIGKGNMRINFVNPFGGIDINAYQEGQIVITFFDKTVFRQGYNTVELIHTGCPICPLSEDTLKLFNDIDIGSNPSIINEDLSIVLLNTKYLSGVSYIGENSILGLSFDVLNGFNNVYHISNAPATFDDNPSDWGVLTTSVPYTDGTVSGVSTPPDIGETMIVTNKEILVPTNIEENDAQITITPRDPYGSYIPVTTASQNLMIMSFGNPSTATEEFFRDEDYRIPLNIDFDIAPSNPATIGNWDSSISLAAGTTGYTTSLQVYDPDVTIKNILIHPETDYTGRIPVGPDYTGLAGGSSYRYVRLFQDQNTVDRFNGIISIPGIVDSDLGTNINIFIKVPGRTAWLDATAPFVLGTFAANAPVGNPDFVEGCRINSGVNSPDLNGRIEFTLGPIGTEVSSGHAIYVMIEYANNSIPNVLNGTGQGFSIINW